MAELIRQEGGVAASRSVLRLYKFALQDGPRIIHSFKKELGATVVEELSHALIAEKLAAIVEAQNPKAFFRTALVRRAITWQRRGDATVAATPDESISPKPVAGSTGHTQGRDIGEEAERREFVHDARLILDSLSDRDRQIVVAVALGDDREAVARAFGTTRANVDQIVSRVRKLLKGGAS